MVFKLKKNNKDGNIKDNIIYDNGTLKVVLLASLIIVLSVVIMGTISYVIANNALVTKLKTKDMVYIAQSISAKIDGRIERAKETSVILSRDPAIVKWVEGAEKDEVLSRFAKDKITGIAKSYDYNNTFIVSAVTNNYWAEDGRLIDNMSKDDLDDTWFFDTINSKQPVSVVIDYNKERRDTFVFVNALMGDINKPLAVTGVGLNLKDISKEFESYKFGKKSNMWLVDKRGNIYISEDTDQLGKNISNFVPPEVSKEIISADDRKISDVLDYKNIENEVVDLIYEPIKSTDWKLVLQIPRVESISVVNSIKVNTAAASLITMILIVFMFYLISNKMANPYKRALSLSRELERKVNERTHELNEKNIKIMDSIEYAKMIQESILPSDEELQKVLKEHFIIWKPRDIVGGDFYWMRKLENGFIFAVGDCTGHGVPGALMTMAVNSALNYIVNEVCRDNPALILKGLDRFLKQTLHRKNQEKSLNDGLDIGILFVGSDNRAVFSGAKIQLYIGKSPKLEIIKGDCKSIGYRDYGIEYEFTNHEVDITGDEVLYMTTDGYIDQNGGERNYSFGRKKFEELIERNTFLSLSKQKQIFESELAAYMGNEVQRDDITIAALKLRPGKEA